MLVVIHFVHDSRFFQMEERASIKLCDELGKTFTEMLEMIHRAYGDDSLSCFTVYTGSFRINATMQKNCSTQKSRPVLSKAGRFCLCDCKLCRIPLVCKNVYAQRTHIYGSEIYQN